MPPQSSQQLPVHNPPRTKVSGGGTLVVWFMLLGTAFWPRLWIAGFWIFDHHGIGQAFSSWVIPALGFVLLPWTTLMYAWMWAIDSDGVHGWEWTVVAIAFVVDIAFWAVARRSLRS